MFREDRFTRLSPLLDVQVDELTFDVSPFRNVVLPTAAAASVRRFERIQALTRSMPIQAAVMVALVGVLGLLVQAMPERGPTVLASSVEPETTGSISVPSLRSTLP